MGLDRCPHCGASKNVLIKTEHVIGHKWKGNKPVAPHVVWEPAYPSWHGHCGYCGETISPFSPPRPAQGANPRAGEPKA